MVSVDKQSRMILNLPAKQTFYADDANLVMSGT